MAKCFAILLVVTSLLVIVCHQPKCIAADKIDIGVVLSRKGTGIPSATDIVALYKKYNIGKIRLLQTEPDILNALKGSDIAVTLTVPNGHISLMSKSQDDAEWWVRYNLAPYIDGVTFSYISIGNEAIPSGENADSIVKAMNNLRTVLRARGLNGITVTTTVSLDVLQNIYPPSAATFKPEAKALMMDVLNFTRSRLGSPILLINVYPYYNFSADPYSVGLEFAQFTATQPKFHDQNLAYYNLFDAMVDGFFWALEKVNAADMVVAVTETGWPTYGNYEYTNPMFAATYNKKFMEHILSHAGTPKRPGLYIEGFIYSMFNENQRPDVIKQNFGLFNVDMTPVYPFFPSN